MKRLIICAALLLPAIAFAQQPQQFTIRGQVANAVPPAKVYLFYTLGANKVVDSTTISLSKYQFTGTVLFPVQATLLLAHKGESLEQLDNKTADMLSFYLEPGVTTVGAIDSVSRAKVTGSQLNDDNKFLMDQLAPIVADARQIQTDAQRATLAQKQSPDFQSGIQTRLKMLQVRQQKLFVDFVTAHPKSYLSLLVLGSLASESVDPGQLNKLYEQLDPSVKGLEPARQLKTGLDAALVTAIGSMAPDFTEADVNGNPVKLSQFRGKYVLLDFWASWCGPCREENPNVVRAYNRYKTKNFTIVGVSLDRPNSKAEWMNAIKADGLVWTQVSDLNYWNNQAAVLYKVTAIPQNFLIDPNGKIIAKNLRGQDLEDKLAELFGKI